MSEKMLRFSEVNWPSVIGPSDSVIDLCLRSGLPVYIKVQREDHLVYLLRRVTLRSGQPSPVVWRQDGWQVDPEQPDASRIEIVTLPFGGFDDELIFLRLDNFSLAELATSRFTTVSSFSRDGFSMPRPYRVTGRTRGGYEIRKYEEIKNSVLKKVEFDQAFLIDRMCWGRASLELKTRFLSGSGLEEIELKELFAKSVITENAQLYFVESDVENLKQGMRLEIEQTLYPFHHREQMPGIYWMFRAAEMLKAGHVTKDGVQDWLKTQAPGVYRYKSERTAAKFVWPDVDRAQGGGGRSSFVLEDLDDWTSSDNYRFTFASRGLSYVLACADWWFNEVEKSKERGEKVLPPKNALAGFLLKNKFGGHEVGHLVYLMTGAKLSDAEVLLIEKFQDDEGYEIEPVVENQWKISGTCLRSPKERENLEAKRASDRFGA